MSEGIVYGINPVDEALKGRRRKPLELFVARDGGSRVRALADTARRRGVPVRDSDKRELERLAGNARHQGAVLRIEPCSYVELDDLLKIGRDRGEPAFLLALDGVTDPHNFGALLRSAAGAGCHGVICPRDNSAPVTGVVERAAAGALEHVALCRVVNLARTFDLLKREGLWIYGLAGEADQAVYSIDFTSDLVLVVGSEGKGLRPNVRRHCDQLISIPMQGGVGSLNVSVAGALSLFEVVRQRHKG